MYIQSNKSNTMHKNLDQFATARLFCMSARENLFFIYSSRLVYNFLTRHKSTNQTILEIRILRNKNDKSKILKVNEFLAYSKL